MDNNQNKETEILKKLIEKEKISIRSLSREETKLINKLEEIADKTRALENKSKNYSKGITIRKDKVSEKKRNVDQAIKASKKEYQKIEKEKNQIASDLKLLNSNLNRLEKLNQVCNEQLPSLITDLKTKMEPKLKQIRYYQNVDPSKVPKFRNQYSKMKTTLTQAQNDRQSIINLETARQDQFKKREDAEMAYNKGNLSQKQVNEVLNSTANEIAKIDQEFKKISGLENLPIVSLTKAELPSYEMSQIGKPPAYESFDTNFSDLSLQSSSQPSTSKSEVGPPPQYEDSPQPSTSKAGTASPRCSTSSLSESIVSSTSSSKNSNLSRNSSQKSHDFHMTRL